TNTSCVNFLDGKTMSFLSTNCPAGGPAVGASLTINAVGAADTIIARVMSGGFPNATSSSFNVTAGAATKLLFTQQPSGAQAGQSFSVQVQVTDASGNPVGQSGTSVTMAFGANPGGATLGGTLTQITNAQGQASFNNLTVNKVANNYTLVATGGGF